ncbi:MAG: transketolase C-terminal domain-containing protein [Thermoleophilia bacterium]
MRCGQALNAALHEVMAEREDVYLLGEDVLDPYGGAFKITAGLSDRFGGRVTTTPISEAALIGVATGMALRGLRPIVEIVFGDFIALGFDQLLNSATKFGAIGGGAPVPLVVRAPMGGRRGYGATHSQSLEKHLLGIPHLRLLAASECHDLAAMLRGAVDDPGPVVLIENKLMYGRPTRQPVDGWIDEFACRTTGGPWPALTLSGNGFGPAAATIVAYGGMAPLAIDAATELVLEHEVFTEVVLLGQLLPLELDAVVESVGRTGALVTAEEGTLTGGIGAEIAARVGELAWDALRGPVRRVAARDTVVPAAPALEAAMLPQASELVDEVLELVGARTGSLR